MGLNITTLDSRRKREDLIEFYTILNGLECVVWKNELVKMHQEGTVGPANNLRRKRCPFTENQLMWVKYVIISL